MTNEVDVLFDTKKNERMSLSYSKLSKFDTEGPQALLDRTFIISDGVRMGSLVDDLLFNEKNINKLYYEFNGSKPTATLAKLCNIILNNYNKVPSKKIIDGIIEVNKFWSGTKDPKLLRAKYDTKDFWEYIKAQFISKEKTLITTEELMLAQELRDILLIHNNSAKIFESDYISQFKIKFIYKNFVLKGILDIIKLDHENKTIRLIDLKTGANKLTEFITSFIKYRYYLQESIYMLAIDYIKKKLKVENYKVLPFQFLYISRFEKIPFIYTVSDKWHEAALKGFKTEKGYTYKGIDQLLDDVKWHLDNKVFDFSKEIYEANGELLINDEFINIIK